MEFFLDIIAVSFHNELHVSNHFLASHRCLRCAVIHEVLELISSRTILLVRIILRPIRRRSWSFRLTHSSRVFSYLHNSIVVIVCVSQFIGIDFSLDVFQPNSAISFLLDCVINRRSIPYLWWIVELLELLLLCTDFLGTLDTSSQTNTATSSASPM